MTWFHGDKEFDENLIADNVGFVYIIRNLISGRAYVGQKKFHSTTRRKLASGKRKKKVTDSDWKEYWGSNAELQADVAANRPEDFRREILHLCPSKAIMNYLELQEQIDRRVMLSDAYYNSYVGGRISKKHLTKLQK